LNLTRKRSGLHLMNALPRSWVSGPPLSVVVEREIPHPPEKILRALTQSPLIEEWLTRNDFKPVADHRLSLRGDWGAVEYQVLTVDANKTRGCQRKRGLANKPFVMDFRPLRRVVGHRLCNGSGDRLQMAACSIVGSADRPSYTYRTFGKLRDGTQCGCACAARCH